MKKFTRKDVDEFLADTKLRQEEVPVPEFGYVYTVRELSGEERDEWESSVVKLNGSEVTIDSSNLRARLVAMCVIDEDGERCFTQQHVAALGKKSAIGLDRLVDVAKRLSRVTEGDMEALGKDSGPVRSVASASA